MDTIIIIDTNSRKVSHILEPLVRDNLWQYLKIDPDIDAVAAEVSLGEFGQIDLVAQSGDSYIGYEVKSETLSRNHGKQAGIIRQLEKYRDSGYLDKVFICSIEPEEYELLLSDEYYIVGGAPPGTNSLNGFRDSLAYSITEGEYTISDLREAVEIPDVTNTRRTNNRVTSNGRIEDLFSSVKLRLARNYNIDSNTEIIEFTKAIKTIEDLIIEVPREIGIMGLPIQIERGEAPRYGTKLISDLNDSFCPGKEIAPVISQEAKPLTRSKTPSLDFENEAWISHHIWVQEGGMREGTLPNPNGNRAKRVDNLSINGSMYPQEIVADPSSGSIKVYEAKTGLTLGYWNRRIKDQLKSYLSSSSFSHLYLAVPDSEVDTTRGLIKESKEEWISYVGLVSVGTDGDVTDHIEPKQIPIAYDGWSTSQGRKRTVGYGKLIIPNEPDHAAIFEEDNPAQDVDSLIENLF